jgi:ubiquinone/menaquinone biosynthesis C-methylase UbiE
MKGATVLDLACGTGQNFPFLAERIGPRGKIVGVDISSGMLKKARYRVERSGQVNISLLQADAINLSRDLLNSAITVRGLILRQDQDDGLLRGKGSAHLCEAQTGVSSVDCVVCTYGFMAMRQWESVFWSSWSLLKPGGRYLIHDVDAERGNLHAFAVEVATRCNFTHKVWRPLQGACIDFRMDYLDPSAHLFGGRLFVASGAKPA